MDDFDFLVFHDKLVTIIIMFPYFLFFSHSYIFNFCIYMYILSAFSVDFAQSVDCVVQSIDCGARFVLHKL